MKHLALLLFLLSFHFILTGQDNSDCETAYIVCDLSNYSIDSLQGVGLDSSEGDNTCFSIENQSTWFKWTCTESGTLVFTIDPIQEYSDFDFAVYQLLGGIDDCNNKSIVRCNAAYGGLDFVTNEPTTCSDETGLNFESTDLEEDAGCDIGEDGFLRFLDMEAGESYALFITNFSGTGVGFALRFDGTATLVNENCSEITSDTEELINLEADVSIYPNPVKESTTLFVSDFSNAKSPMYTIFNLYGQRIEEQKIDNQYTTINLSNYTGSTFFLQVRDENGILGNKIIVRE
jgi:hypothetical protein